MTSFISCRISLYSGTCGSVIDIYEVVFNGEQEKESIIYVRVA